MNFRDNASPSGIVSGTVGVDSEGFVGDNDPDQVDDNDCREVLLWAAISNHLLIGETSSKASSGVLLPLGFVFHLPMSNTNKIFSDNLVQVTFRSIVWRS